MKLAFLTLPFLCFILSCSGNDAGDPGKPNESHSVKPGWIDTLQSAFTTKCAVKAQATPTRSGMQLDSVQAQDLCICVLKGIMLLYTPNQLNSNQAQAQADVPNIALGCATEQGLISSAAGTATDSEAEVSLLDQSIESCMSEI